MVLPLGPHRRYDPLSDQWVLVSAGRTQRPWQGHKERVASVETRPSYDPACYLCPGNTRVSGGRNPDYTSTWVFTNDFAALRPDAGDDQLHDGLLVAEAQPGTCRVLCFSPRHDLTLSRMTPDSVLEVIAMWARQTVELGADWQWVQDLREPRRGDGCLQSPSTRPDLGRCSPARPGCPGGRLPASPSR